MSGNAERVERCCNAVDPLPSLLLAGLVGVWVLFTYQALLCESCENRCQARSRAWHCAAAITLPLPTAAASMQQGLAPGLGTSRGERMACSSCKTRLLAGPSTLPPLRCLSIL